MGLVAARRIDGGANRGWSHVGIAGAGVGLRCRIIRCGEVACGTFVISRSTLAGLRSGGDCGVGVDGYLRDK